jgi:glycosyltransferase involved in cell wall biosynthesis
VKIGIFTDTYLPATDGVVVSIGTFRQELEKLGHQVLVFAPEYHGQPAKETEVIRFRNLAFPPYPEYKLVFPFSRSFKASDFPRLGLDVVHVQTPLGLGFYAAWLARRHNLPRLFTYHTYFDEYLHYLWGPKFFHRWLVRGLTRWYCDLFPLVLTPSQSIQKVLQGYGVRSRIEVLPTGFKGEGIKAKRQTLRRELGLKPGEFLVASAGRLGKEKSWDLVLKAFCLALNSGLKARMVLMGDGPEGEALKSLASVLGLDGKVQFTGMVPRARLLQTLAAADLFLFGSQSETQGMVLLEALSQGTPAVAVDALGPGDLLKGDRGGILCPPDPRLMAQAVLKLAKDKRLMAAKRREAKVLAAEHSSSRMARKLLGYYEEVIRAAKKGR